MRDGQTATVGNRRTRFAERLAAAVLGCALAALVVAPFVPRRLLVEAVGITAEEVLEAAAGDGQLQAEAIALLLDQAPMREVVGERLARDVDTIYDSHLDPEVGRILLPNLDRYESLGIEVTTNAFGLREKTFAPRKPAGVTRVVLLGDSFVFGYGAQRDARIGAHLERLLQPFCPTPRLEVLHFGVSSWNAQAECAYLRRQIDVVDPDLVIHLVVSNDLLDSAGAGGTGMMSRFSTQARLRGETSIGGEAMRGVFPRPVWNHVTLGQDWEGRERYRRAAAAIEELIVAAEANESGYLLVKMMGPVAARAHELLVTGIDPARVASIPNSFAVDEDHWNSPNDKHWNSLACERVAQGLLALIAERGLLAGWAIDPGDRALRERELIFDAGDEEALDMEAFERTLARKTFVSEFRVPPADVVTAAAATGGIDKHGNVSTYASLCMRRAGAALVIDARILGRPALIGARMEVFVDEFRLGDVALDDARSFPARFELPALVEEREIVSVRLRSDDHAYLNPFGEPTCLRLRSVSFE